MENAWEPYTGSMPMDHDDDDDRRTMKRYNKFKTVVVLLVIKTIVN